MTSAHSLPRPAGADSPRGEDVEAIRRALVELRRLFQRKELVELWSAAFGRAADVDYSELRLLDAIHVAVDVDGATVGDVARLLGVDPSRASRQVARAVADGLLERRTSPTDGRTVILAITPRGARLQAKGSDLTRARIALAIDGWPVAQRRQFADQLAKFVGSIAAPGAARALSSPRAPAYSPAKRGRRDRPTRTSPSSRRRDPR